MPPERIAVVGVTGDGRIGMSARALELLDSADLVVGGRRHLDAVAPAGVRAVPIDGDVDAALDEVAAEPGAVCVLASGDPGFFGMARPLAARFGPDRIEVHPQPSSVAVAFARLGLPWDDATVISAHGRPLGDAARVAAARPKVAVLVSPDSPPEALGKELLRLGACHRRVAVCSRLGAAGERVVLTDLDGLAAGTWDPLSVVVLVEREVTAAPVLAWGLPEAEFAHREGMITKAEVRAVALGKLTLPRAGVLWDVGAGSGSVAVECARLAPALRVVAVERDPDQVARLRDNAARHEVVVEVVQGGAPAALAGLPDPDRAFVGGGGTDVLDAVLARLRPGGTVVATFAALDRAAAGADRLGNVVQVSVHRGVPVGASTRLQAENPVFVAWGPGADG